MESSSNIIFFSTQIKSVADNSIVDYKKDRFIASMNVEKNKISMTYLEETAKIIKGENTNIEQLLNEIRLKTEQEKLDYFLDIVTKLFFTMNEFLGKFIFKHTNS